MPPGTSLGQCVGVVGFQVLRHLPKCFYISKEPSRAAGRFFGEADWTAWSEMKYRVGCLHVSGSSAVKGGEYLPHMGSLKRIKL